MDANLKPSSMPNTNVRRTSIIFCVLKDLGSLMSLALGSGLQVLIPIVNVTAIKTVAEKREEKVSL